MLSRSLLRSQAVWLLAGLIAFLIGLQVRIYPLTHNLASDAYEQATMLVITRIRMAVAAQVNAQFPEMPPDKKAAVISAKVNEVLHKDNAKVRKAFDDVGYQILRKTGNEKRYLQESDSYYFLNLTQNILDKGDVSPQVRGNRYFNDLMLAPLGFWEPQLWHPYVGAMVYRVIHAFSPSTDLMTAVAWTPIVLLPFVIAAFLLACRAMGCSPLTSFTACVFFVLAQIYLKRSTYAWYDNDTYTVLFPTLMLAFFFLALKHVDRINKLVLFTTLAAASAAVYAMFWPGWGYLWGLTTASAVLIAGKAFLLKELRLPRLSLLIVLLILLPILMVTLMVGLPQFLDTIVAAWGELKKFTAPGLNGWPDLFIVVGELKRASWQDVITLTGGIIPFAAAIAVPVWSVAGLIRHRRAPSDEVITLTLFLAATLVLSLSAQRFAMLSIPPVALLFAYGLERSWQARGKLAERLKLSERTSQIFTKSLGAVIVLSVIIPIVTSNLTIRSLLNPIFNSAWDRALTKLRDNSPPDAVVNTWWSPGHFVKAIAHRRVTFDGASIRGEQGYWLTRVYLAQEERDALGILRMMNTSANRAAEYLQKLDLPLSSAVPLLLEVTHVRKAEAERALSKVLPGPKVEALLKLTHGEGAPPPSYVLIYNEIMDGNVLLGYVGKWDFAKIEKLNQDPDALRKIPRKSSPRFIDFLWSLVGGPYKQTNPLGSVATDGSKIAFEGGIIVDTATMTALVNSDKFGRGVPASLVYLDEAQGAVVEKKLPNATLGFSVVFYKDEGAPKAVLMDRVLANSLIVKMYYFEGKGLRYFKPFAKERDLTGRTRIYIYEVDWPKDF